MKTLYRSALIVTVFSVIQRSLGFLYRIVLSRTIGSEGMGLYQIAVALFMVLLTASSSGIPVTVSRLLTKYRTQNDLRAQNASVTAGVVSALAATLPVSLLLFLLREPLASLFSDARSETVLFLLLPGLSFSAAHTVLRGYYWGNKDFLPYSVTELVEELVMILVGTALVCRIADPFEGAMRAAIAITASNLVSFSLAFFWFLSKGGRFSSPKGQFRPLLSAAVPISAMRTSASAIDSVIAFLLPARLRASGMTATEALKCYGVATGMSFPVLAAPSSLIGSFALVLVPELSENYYRGKGRALKANVEEAISVAAVISCLFIPPLALFGEEAGLLLFSDRLSGKIIAYSSYLLLPLSLNMISSGILNSMQGEKVTLIAFAVGSVCLLTCVVLLPPLIGIYAICVGSGLEAIAASSLQFFFLYKRCPQKPRIVRPVLLSLLPLVPAFLLGALTKPLLFRFFSAVPAIAIGCVLTVGVALAFYAFLGLLPRPKLLRKKHKIQENFA